MSHLHRTKKKNPTLRWVLLVSPLLQQHPDQLFIQNTGALRSVLGSRPDQPTAISPGTTLIGSLRKFNLSPEQQQPFIDLVSQILGITKDEDYLLSQTKQGMVKEYQSQIDRMVYKLYGLTEEEIGVVEGSLVKNRLVKAGSV